MQCSNWSGIWILNITSAVSTVSATDWNLRGNIDLFVWTQNRPSVRLSIHLILKKSSDWPQVCLLTCDILQRWNIPLESTIQSEFVMLLQDVSAGLRPKRSFFHFIWKNHWFRISYSSVTKNTVKLKSGTMHDGKRSCVSG